MDKTQVKLDIRLFLPVPDAEKMCLAFSEEMVAREIKRFVNTLHTLAWGAPLELITLDGFYTTDDPIYRAETTDDEGGCIVGFQFPIHSPTAFWELVKFQDVLMEMMYYDFQLYITSGGYVKARGVDWLFTNTAEVRFSTNNIEDNDVVTELLKKTCPDQQEGITNAQNGHYVVTRRPNGFYYCYVFLQSGDATLVVTSDKDVADNWAFYNSQCGLVKLYWARGVDKGAELLDRTAMHMLRVLDVPPTSIYTNLLHE